LCAPWGVLALAGRPPISIRRREADSANQAACPLAPRGYNTPTPIQAQAIPEILKSRDILGIAQTGTGKTAAFVLPMIDILAAGRARARMPRTLILEPTRELAAQVAENFDKYGKYHKLTKALLIGGVSFGDQDQEARRAASTC
jgi:superfamily II DNA/RNA helicase